MTAACDVLVIGVGGVGAAALRHLAKRGVRAIGIERFEIAHGRGSSHGETRVIRQAYFEHPDYVPLLRSAYRLWDELATEAGRPLFRRCGLILSGPPEGEVIAGSRSAAGRHDIPIESLDRDSAATRFRRFRFPEGHRIVFEPGAGYLLVEECVRAHAEAAVRLGAKVRTGETVLGWSADASGVRVRTDRGEYVAGSAVVTAGAWAAGLLTDLAAPLTVLRKVTTWHRVPEGFGPDDGTPTYLFDLGGRCFYGFPSLDGRTIKVAEHTGGEPVADPLTVDRSLRPEDAAPLADFLRAALPAADPEPVRHSVCLYTMSPDGHFLVGRRPDAPVAFAAGLSGHGFKFAPVLGEALADLALDGRTRHPVGFLSPERFGPPGRP
ncbi:MAG TPA: N-methyl-L-tryptophan oxidase [Planctomycetaceae bacterium]